MGCNCQSASGVGATAADPCRRVNYTLGMILGVDDFVQEQVYQNAHREAINRLALGYGTLSGLKVEVQGKAPNPVKVMVGSGFALAPSGRMVRVPLDQCCVVSEWFGANPPPKDGPVQSRDGMEGTWTKAWLSLTYREDLCADVPIPGEACRTDDKLVAPSRIEDSWDLSLSWRRPDQVEEDGIRQFFKWVSRIPSPLPSVDPDGHADPTETAFLAKIRAAAGARLDGTWSEDLSKDPDPFFDSPPDGKDVFKGELLRAVWRLWATDFRPLWSAKYGWAPATVPCDTLLLSGVWLRVRGSKETGWSLDGADAIELDQTHRPVLQSLRAVQEMVRRLPDQVLRSLPDLAGDVAGPWSATSLEAIRGRALSAVPGLVGQVLTVVGEEWKPTDVSGDLTGPLGANLVVGLNGTPVSKDGLADGLFLGYDDASKSWMPRAIPVPISKAVDRGEVPYDLAGAGTVQVDFAAKPSLKKGAKAAAPSPGDLVKARLVEGYEAKPADLEVVDPADQAVVVVRIPVANPDGSSLRVQLTPRWVAVAGEASPPCLTDFRLFVQDALDDSGQVVPDIVEVRILVDVEAPYGFVSFQYQVFRTQFATVTP